MARFKNIDWTLPKTASDGAETWDHVKIAVLMDIRDELQALNRLLNCHNVIGGFRALQTINKRMGKFDALKLRKPK